MDTSLLVATSENWQVCGFYTMLRAVMVTVPVKVLYVGGYTYQGEPMYTETILQANDVILFPGPENMRRIIDAHNNVSTAYVD